MPDTGAPTPNWGRVTRTVTAVGSWRYAVAMMVATPLVSRPVKTRGGPPVDPTGMVRVAGDSMSAVVSFTATCTTSGAPVTVRSTPRSIERRCRMPSAMVSRTTDGKSGGKLTDTGPLVSGGYRPAESVNTTRAVP